MRILLYAFTLLSLSPAAFATLTITGVSGASGFTAATTGTSAILYGGLAGPACDSVSPGSSTCNSCDASLTPGAGCTTQPLCTCNSSRINGTGVLQIGIKRDANAKGEFRLYVADSTTGTVIGRPTGADRAEIVWDDLCNAVGGSSCESIYSNGTSVNKNIKVFLDKEPANNTLDGGEDYVDLQIKLVVVPDGSYDVYGVGSNDGIGGSQGFTPYPGDEKIYLRDLDTSSNWPNMTYGVKARSIRVFHSEAGLASAIGSSADPSDISVNSDGSVAKNTVTNGLKNDVTYVFRIALVDEAGNVVQFFPTIGAGGTCDAAPDFTNCPWAATPEKVLGLLTDDFNCFIATAAYGTALEPKLHTFRDFRSFVLLPTKWGRSFVYGYYKYGPIAARWISDKPIIRATARIALWPAYWFARLSLKFGFMKGFALSFALLTSLTLITWLAVRRAFARG